jgi:2'-5' RNA ligase
MCDRTVASGTIGHEVECLEETLVQSVCALMPGELFRQVVAVRAALCADPVLGAIYDPPFVHCTLQLAEEYDWPGLASALADFAKERPCFEISTVGLLVFTGQGTAIAVAPRKDQPLREFHAAVWGVISPFAQGRVDPFYHPDRWVPHVTIKRSGSDASAFGAAMGKLAGEDFTQTMTIDNVAVQHDPGKNSLTHYLRLRVPLAGAGEGVVPLRDVGAPTNATLLGVSPGQEANGNPVWEATVRRDDGQEIAAQWDAPTVVRLMADARCSTFHFPGGRCRVDGDGTVGGVEPKTPFPVV